MKPVALEKAGPKRGIVIFDSRYGNTERIARSFEVGLRQAGIRAICTSAKEVNMESLKEYDLIAVGAPTEKLTASKSIKEFLEKLRNVDLSGKFGFVFETRLPFPHKRYPLTFRVNMFALHTELPFPYSGSASKYVEKELKRLGLQIVIPRSSASVLHHKEAKGGVKLKKGEELRFEQLGFRVGAVVAARARKIEIAT